jgi:DNA-binding GntR family transcriptional regulator
MASPGKLEMQRDGIAGKSYLYQDVAAALRERILTARDGPTTKLPSFSELIDEFRVSGITIRRALRELAYEGLICGEQGRGVFIKPRNVIHRVFAGESERSIGEEISRAGFTPAILELKYDRCEADAETSTRLGVETGTKIRRHQKLVFADREPVSLHLLYFIDSMAVRIQRHLADEFVFSLMHRARLKYDHIRFEFSAAALGNDHSKLFGLPAGFPMSLVYYTPITKNGTSILTGVTICRSDRFIFETRLPFKGAKVPRSARASKKQHTPMLTGKKRWKS